MRTFPGYSALMILWLRSLHICSEWVNTFFRPFLPDLQTTEGQLIEEDRPRRRAEQTLGTKAGNGRREIRFYSLYSAVQDFNMVCDQRKIQGCHSSFTLLSPVVRSQGLNIYEYTVLVMCFSSEDQHVTNTLKEVKDPFKCLPALSGSKQRTITKFAQLNSTHQI